MYRLIIADDEQEIREGLAYCIPWEEWGYTVEQCFKSGDSVIQYLTENSVDVALLDIVMDGASGLDVARWIQENGRNIHVILLSGHSDFEFARDALRLGVRDYLLKPTDMEEVQRVFSNLREALDAVQSKVMDQSDALRLLMLSPAGERDKVRLFEPQKGARYALACVRIVNGLYTQKFSHYFTERNWPAGWKTVFCTLEECCYICVQSREPGLETLLSDLVHTYLTRLQTLFNIQAQVVSVRGADTLTELFEEDLGSSGRGDVIDRLLELLTDPKCNLSLSLSDWSAQVGAHPNYVSRRFKEKTGESFSSYLTRLRMRRAQAQLLSTGASVVQISSGLGYFDVKHFCSLFKAEFGCTPTQLRASARRGAL